MSLERSESFSDEHLLEQPALEGLGLGLGVQGVALRYGRLPLWGERLGDLSANCADYRSPGQRPGFP